MRNVSDVRKDLLSLVRRAGQTLFESEPYSTGVAGEYVTPNYDATPETSVDKASAEYAEEGGRKAHQFVVFVADITDDDATPLIKYRVADTPEMALLLAACDA